MLDSNKWSIYKISMLIVAVIYIIIRILGVLFVVEMSQMQILGILLLGMIPEVALLLTLLFVPNQYRMLAIIPLLYMVTKSSVELVGSVSIGLQLSSSFGYIFTNIIKRAADALLFMFMLIFMLPMIQYKKDHVIIPIVILITFIFLYLTNIVANLGYLSVVSPLGFIDHIVIRNLVLYISIPIIFTLYILIGIEDQKKKNLMGSTVS
ncbi:MAG: hypothetical protein KKH92_06680 [Firmicutes bacterium]|nr:hypothetical protein [Bacillota bacterium]